MKQSVFSVAAVTYDADGEGMAPEYRLPCSCGCDYRDMPDLKGYFIFNDGKRGVTIHVSDQELHDEIVQIFNKLDNTRNEELM